MFVHLGSLAQIAGADWVRRGLELVPPADARILARRWGLDGGTPRSIAELAREEGVPPIAMVRRLQEAERRLLRAMAAARPAAAPGSGQGSSPGVETPGASPGSRATARPPAPAARGAAGTGPGPGGRPGPGQPGPGQPGPQPRRKAATGSATGTASARNASP
ncbi:hypothetical protein [Thermaerobacter subterraneus]|uniref:Uncharacterized protein n=1 Tax=Thermaerobacter subterraneus DSM 13965 TaxID=867903 RepID=K6QE18_9FIRM|nr:hypothetical protein [Thermaerobacter subterraneus]EKP94986.1 hypothetical protein ThesuDRAFT_00709 [Thermaerobacter subterraneus DSM 13965]